MVEQTIFHWIVQYGCLGLFFLLVLGIVGLPVPDETLLTFVGYLIYKGDFHLVPALAAAFSGSMCGISLSYGLGRIGGLPLVRKYGPVIHIEADKIERARNWFEHKGKWSLTLGYFVPGVRHLTAFMAGTTALEYSIFAVFAYAGGLIWSTTFLTVGYLVGKEWAQASEKIHNAIVIAVCIIGVVVLMWYLLSHALHKGD